MKAICESFNSKWGLQHYVSLAFFELIFKKTCKKDKQKERTVYFPMKAALRKNEFQKTVCPYTRLVF